MNQNLPRRMANIQIRSLGKEDYSDFDRLMRQLHQLHVEQRPDLYLPMEHFCSREDFEKLLDSEDSIALCADTEKRITGLCLVTLRKKSVMVEMTSAYMDALVVDKICRHQGIAKALFRQAEQLAREKGAQRLDLMVWAFNQEAQAIYEHMGMTPQRYIYEKKL